MNAIINDHKAIRKATFAFPEDRPQSEVIAMVYDAVTDETVTADEMAKRVENRKWNGEA